MPYNPERLELGGDVEGKRKIFVTQGEALEVAEASFDAGYGEGQLENTLKAGYINKADLTRGYCDYGVSTGDISVQDLK